jgi:hypothetical protein
VAADLATPDDVEAALLRPLTDNERTFVPSLIKTASSKLRQKAPFDIDARIALFTTQPTATIALDPVLVASVVAKIVKNVVVNTEGLVSESQGTGPFSQSKTFVSRYDKTGADARGSIQVTDADIEELRPAVPAAVAGSIRLGLPAPQVLIPHGVIGPGGRVGPVIVPDLYPDTGAE